MKDFNLSNPFFRSTRSTPNLRAASAKIQDSRDILSLSEWAEGIGDGQRMPRDPSPYSILSDESNVVEPPPAGSHRHCVCTRSSLDSFEAEYDESTTDSDVSQAAQPVRRIQTIPSRDRVDYGEEFHTMPTSIPGPETEATNSFNPLHETTSGFSTIANSTLALIALNLAFPTIMLAVARIPETELVMFLALTGGFAAFLDNFVPGTTLEHVVAVMGFAQLQAIYMGIRMISKVVAK